MTKTPAIRKLAVRGMRCAGCAAKVEKTVAAIPEVKNAQVNYAAAVVTFAAPAAVSDEEIIAAIKKAGFTAEPPPADPAAEAGWRAVPALLPGVILALKQPGETAAS